MLNQPNLTQIQHLEEKHYPGILAVAEDLPEWFDQTARTKSIPMDIRHQDGFVAVSGQKVVGFVTLYVAEGRLHIGWLGATGNVKGKDLARGFSQPQRRKREIWG